LNHSKREAGSTTAITARHALFRADARSFPVIAGQPVRTSDPGNNGAGESLCVDHLVQHHWRYVGGEGEGILFACGKQGMPSNIAPDLKITCA